MSIKIAMHTFLFAAATLLVTGSTPYLLTSDGSLENSAIVGTMAQSQIAAGDRFMHAGEMGSAEEAYRVAAILERARRQLPVEAVRRSANARFYQADYAGAARVLAGLADEAAALGDVTTEFWAIVDAAWLAALADDTAGFKRHIGRAARLLQLEPFAAAGQAERLGRAMKSTDPRVVALHLPSW